MRIRTTLGLLLGLIAVCSVWIHAQQRQPAPGYGAVEGSVVDKHGRPVPGATVSAFWMRPSPGPSVEVHTNAQGVYFLDHVRPGANVIVAYDEPKDYPNAAFAFYSSHSPYPEVHIRAGQIIKGITVPLGPKGARLVGRISDAVTGRPIGGGGITFYHAGSFQDYAGFSLARDGTFNLLVPANRRFRMSVDARGYQTWYYGSDGTKEHATAIRMKPGATQVLDIRLQPATPIR